MGGRAAACEKKKGGVERRQREMAGCCRTGVNCQAERDAGRSVAGRDSCR